MPSSEFEHWSINLPKKGVIKTPKDFTGDWCANESHIRSCKKSISYITFSQWQYKSAFCHEYSLCRFFFFFSWGYQSFLMLVCWNVVTLWSVTTPDECVLYWVAKSRLHCVEVCLKRSNVARHSANTIIVNILNRNTITKALYSSIFIVVKLKFAGYIL